VKALVTVSTIFAIFDLKFKQYYLDNTKEFEEENGKNSDTLLGKVSITT
jgi:hypothetical protein